MFRMIGFFSTFFLLISEFVTSEVINCSVANLYLIPQENTELNTQLIYGSDVEVISYENDWVKIRGIDGAEGWVLSSQITSNSSYEDHENLRPVKSLFAHIYRVADTTPYPPLLTLPYGAPVKLYETTDKGVRWVLMELVSGEKAWIQRGDIDFEPHVKTLEEVLTFSKKFLGLPYTWGGTSSFGFDCSGFMQMLFREMGLQIPRNSRAQVKCSLFTPVDREDLQPGDLVFFGQTRVTHVGMYLGNDEFIHSGVTEMPMIMISNINNDKYHFQAARRIDFFRNSL